MEMETSPVTGLVTKLVTLVVTKLEIGSMTGLREFLVYGLHSSSRLRQDLTPLSVNVPLSRRVVRREFLHLPHRLAILRSR